MIQGIHIIHKFMHTKAAGISYVCNTDIFMAVLQVSEDPSE